MSTPADPNAFNDDGTPRRRYEIEEVERGKPILLSSISVLLANAFILIKTLLFTEDTQKVFPTAGAAKAPEGASSPEPDLVAQVPTLDEVEGTDEGEEIEAGKKKGSSTLLPQSEAVSYDPDLWGEERSSRRSSGLPQASNDNEALYGATPGSSISLFDPIEIIGGGSGGGDGIGSGHDDDADEDADDDGDDDNSSLRNRLPVVTAPVVLSGAFANEPVVIALADLLRNASDPDGDALSVRSVTPSSGTIVQRADGNFVFTPIYGDTSSVTFTYSISDGKGSVLQNAVMDLLPSKGAPIVGSAASETIIGTPTSDEILALGGDDLVIGREGSDVIYGGDGDDRILGGEGDDVIYGEAGNDVIFAGPGRDTVSGGPGDDKIFGEEGDDTLRGDEGDDTISGGSDNDTISGGTGNDELRGDKGNDVILGDEGTDNIEGGDGDDTIAGGAGADTAKGGSGDDTVVALPDDGNDAYDGGEGSDTYDLSSATADAVIDLESELASSDDIGTDQISNFENVSAGSGDDIIVANDRPNELSGGSGEDVFVFRSSLAVGHGSGYRDRILDFETGDKIDLDGISREFADAFEDTFKDQGIKKFVLIGEQDAFTKPGQIKVQYEQHDDADPIMVLAGNTDYDADAEFELEFAGTHEISDRDFYWHT